MQTPSQLDLTHLPMEEPGFAENPYPYFEAAREKHPWLASCSAGYIVHCHKAMKDLLLMDDHMRTAHDGIVALMGASGTPWGRFEEENMNALSGLAHRKLRDIVAPLFTPRQANRNRPLMREIISTLLDEWVPKAAFDFEEFASHFPISVICAMIGAPQSEIPRLRSSLEAMGLSFSLDRDHLPALQGAMTILDDFVQQLVAQRHRRAKTGNARDLLDTLLEATSEGGMTDRQLYDMLIFLFVAGYDTSKNVLTLIMHAMIDRPGDYRRCAEDLSFCKNVVEETLRYNNPATIPRLTTDEVIYRDVSIPKGTMLFFPVSVSGRDPGSFADADKFDAQRSSEERHLAFGRGMHLCLGQFIARAQIEEGFHLIAQRIRNPRLTGTVRHRLFPGVWGLKGLPIAFDPH